MAKNRDPRRGFVARWFHRLRWIRRALFISGVVGGVVKAVQARSGGPPSAGTGRPGGGPGGPGRPAPTGGPTGPRLAASTSVPSDDDDADLDPGAATSTVRTLVSVPPTDLDDESEAADDSAAGSTAPVLTIVGDDDVASAGDSWVPPLDGGECPPGYPVKANDNSGIYHVPGGRSYNRTAAQRCYASAEAAEADGYRPAKA